MANRNQTLYDVAIVGTGPSGSLLAHEFATAGWAVLLLEKKHLPRYKTCGGGLTQRALQLIPFDIQEVIEDQAHTTRLRVHYQTAFSQTRHLPAVRLVMRDRLDHLLAQHAVGADGAYSRVARALNLPIHYRVMPALEAELTVPPVCPIAALPDPFILTSASFREAMPGFFPKKDHLSAGILARCRPAKQLKPYFLRYLENNGLSREADIRSMRLHPIPCRPAAGTAMPITTVSSWAMERDWWIL